MSNKEPIINKTDKLKKGKQSSIKFPSNLLQPIAKFLSGRARELEMRKNKMSKGDPFKDTRRLIDNAAADLEAVEQAGHESVSALKFQIDRQLIQVRKAMTRLKLGKYGICEKCGKMIDTDRLVIMPEATTCIECSKKK